MLFQDTFDLASEYFHCHMKYSRSSTHNICNIYYNNNNNKIDLTHELNILNKLHDDFELGNEGSSKLSESYMNNIICKRRVKKLNSISIAHGYCFLGERHIFIEELTATCVVVFVAK